MKTTFLLVLLLAFYLTGCSQSATDRESADLKVPGNRDLIVNGSPLNVLGVCYQPAPIGSDPTQEEPYGDYYTKDFADLYERDLPLMRRMGANAVRIYGWSDKANHDHFLDACYNGGVDPIYVLVNLWIDPHTDWESDAAVASISESFTNIDERLGDHPAVMGIVLGNEANIEHGNGDNPAFWAAMNRIAGKIKAQTPERLVSVAITDSVGQVAEFDDKLPNIDFWCLQIYRGTTFGVFFDEYAAASDKPLIVSEYGIDNWDAKENKPYPENGQFVADTVAKLWKELDANASVAAGSFVFSFNDEWWKGDGLASEHDAGGFEMGGFPDKFSNEEWWGLFEVQRDPQGGVDILSPRAAYGALQKLWLGKGSGEVVIK